MAIPAPVNVFDILLLAASEAALGTTPTPANQAAYGALAMEVVTVQLGASETGVIRAKQDRGLGRGMQNGWVEGRVAPIEWSIDTTLKSRADADDPSVLLPFFKAAGFGETISNGVSATYAPVANPFDAGGGPFASMSLTRFSGSALATYMAEILRGAVVRQLVIEGGGTEVMTRWSGVGVGKLTQGGMASATFANDSGTTLTHTSDESYLLQPGYYLIESEVILVGAVTPGATSTTVTRGQLGSTAAAHAAKPLLPYRPTAVTFTGAPISEANSTVTLDGDSYRCRSWTVTINTGVDLLEAETGSKYSQGAKYTRFDCTISLQLVLSGDRVDMANRARARVNQALTITQGTGAGNIVTITAPNCETVAFTPPDSNTDVAVVDVQLRLRDGASGGNDMFSIVLT